jgi:hypothetical protein
VVQPDQTQRAQAEYVVCSPELACKHVQQDWNKLSRVFRKKYLKYATPEADRYFTMRQKPAETALEFLYRLNEAGVKANVRFRKSKSECAEHIKRFLKNPRDPQLKIVLRNQRFRRLDDLELVLQQDEDLSLDGGNATPPPPPRTRDYRTDHPSPGRFKPRRSGNAYVAVSEPESDEDVKPHVRFEEEVEEVKPAPPESKNLGRDSPNGDPSNAPTKNALSESEIRSLALGFSLSSLALGFALTSLALGFSFTLLAFGFSLA